MQIGLLEPAGFSPDARTSLEQLGDVSEYRGGDLAAFMRPLEAVFVRLRWRIDGDFVAKAPRLRWICSPTTGHTHLDEQALADRAIEVISLRGQRRFLESIRATPEHTLGLILAVMRRYRGAFENGLGGPWDRDRFVGEDLYGNRVGIIGLGRVGRRVGEYCSALGAEICWYDPADVAGEGAWTRLPDIPALIARARVVVVCASYAAGQRPILGSTEIAALSERYLVNSARGELIDEAALLAAIQQDRLAGVAVDVIADESGAHRLEAWRRAAEGRNVIVTPHIAGATVTAMHATERFVAGQLAERIAHEKVRT